MSGGRAILLVAWREIRERLRGRTFLYSTIFLLLVVGGSTALDGVLGKEKTYRVAVAAPTPAELDGALQRAAEPFDATLRLRIVESEAAGRADLDAEKVDALLLLGASRLLFREQVDVEIAAVADTAVRELRRRLPPTPELATATLRPSPAEPSDAEIVVAVLGAGLLLLSFSIYGQWVLVGVVEEKSNRVVELILSTIPSRHLLAGKVLGIGLLGIGQLALVAGLAAILLAAGAYDAPAHLGGSLALVVPWFALGFALYAVAFAAAGALASRQQDASTAGQPVALTLAAAYFAGYIAVSADPTSLVSHALTVFPLTAPLVLPARSALDEVPLWEHGLAVALTVGAVYALVRFAGRVYSRALLHTGSRLNPRAVWRLARRP